MILDQNNKKRLLRIDEIEVKIGSYNKEKTRFTALLYKTARTDMAILDEIFGWQNWQTEHYQVKDKDFCRISVRLSDGTWISKSDCGDETDYEAKKGESSDAMKRSAVQFGIGRELYTAPKIWFDVDTNIDTYSMKVESIAYDEQDRISDLVITGKIKGERNRRVLFQLGAGKTWTISKNDVEPPKMETTKKVDPPKTEEPKKEEPKKEKPTEDDLAEIERIAERLKAEGKDIPEILMFYGAQTISEVPLKAWQKMLAKVVGA